MVMLEAFTILTDTQFLLTLPPHFDAKVYRAVEGFEESLGLDRNDPLIPFVLFLGLSVTLWYNSCFDIFFFI